MKRLTAVAALFLAFCPILNAEGGLIFARTLRGEAEIKAQGSAVKSGEVASAEGAEISANGGFASFALSNYCACILRSGKIKIEKFEQAEAQTSSLQQFSEKAASNLQISAEDTVAVFARGEARPASKFKILTKFGTFEPAGGNIKIEVDGSTARVSAYDAAVRYSKPGSEEQEYIPIDYELFLSLENGGVKIQKKRLGLADKISLKHLVSSADDAFKTSEFYKDESGKIRARRIAFKEFFIRMPENAK